MTLREVAGSRGLRTVALESTATAFDLSPNDFDNSSPKRFQTMYPINGNIKRFIISYDFRAARTIIIIEIQIRYGKMT